MIDYINDHRYDHILTIEDPIEFVHESNGVWSTSVRCTYTLGFSEALRSALREDPDIIGGEMRTQTIRLALTAAELDTGFRAYDLAEDD